MASASKHFMTLKYYFDTLNQECLQKLVARLKEMSLNFKNDFLQIKEEDHNAVIAVYGMTDKMVQESMESMRQWYRMQPHFPQGALSNDRLFRHLLAVGFSMEKAKVKIDNILTARNIVPEFMLQRDPAGDWYKNAMEYFQFGIMPKRLDDMTRIVVSNYTTKNPSDFILLDVFKSIFMMMDYILSNDVYVGYYFIIDFKEVKMGHVTKVTPTLLKKYTFLLQGCYGLKIKGFHYVNVPQFADLVISLFKSGLGKKVGNRLHIHKDYESLYKVIPKTHLPSDYGGDYKSVKDIAEDLRMELCKPEWRDWFMQQDEVKTDESKRIGVTSDMSNQLLGMHGSFRSLDLD